MGSGIKSSCLDTNTVTQSWFQSYTTISEFCIKIKCHRQIDRHIQLVLWLQKKMATEGFMILYLMSVLDNSKLAFQQTVIDCVSCLGK